MISTPKQLKSDYFRIEIKGAMAFGAGKDG